MVGLLNSIIAGNLGTTDGTNVNVTVASDGYGTFSSQGHNLIGDTNGASGFIASDLLNVAAGLGPLQDNGGPTLTHALLPGSPAIESGTGIGAPSYDQRGFPRPSGRAFDIGAVEFRDQAQLLELGNGRTQILFLIEPNQTYPIQATTNFFNWQTIGSVPSGPGGSYVFEDTAHLPLRFYRVLLQP